MQTQARASQEHLETIAAVASGDAAAEGLPDVAGAAPAVARVHEAVSALLDTQAALKAQIAELQERCSGLAVSNEELRCVPR
jgi:hypothetical protein